MAEEYATYEEVRSYLGVTEDAVSDEDLARPLRQAQEDIDAACGAWGVYDSGLMFYDTADNEILSDLQRAHLSKATCAQVEYRLTVGDDFLVREQHDATSGPGYGTTGTLKKVTGRAYSFLQMAGLLNLTGKVANRDARRSGDIPRAN
jgi:hypothetical protein